MLSPEVNGKSVGALILDLLSSEVLFQAVICFVQKASMLHSFGSILGTALTQHRTHRAIIAMISRVVEIVEALFDNF